MSMILFRVYVTSPIRSTEQCTWRHDSIRF